MDFREQNSDVIGIAPRKFFRHEELLPIAFGQGLKAKS
jgi:hypothetical protein